MTRAELELKTYIVDASLYIVADDMGEAVEYAKQFLKDIEDRDAAGPGATGTLENEPWLMSSAVDNRAEDIGAYDGEEFLRKMENAADQAAAGVPLADREY